MIKIIEESSQDSLVLDLTDTYTVASQISLNLKSEYEAIEGYDKLIPFLELYDDQNSIDMIKEIVSDEKNHSELLNKILMKYDSGIPVAED